jgi:protein-tyrosine phosphatase
VSKPVRVLFLCTGNICRSPTAEGVLRTLAERQGIAHRFIFDSAGTQGYHVGEPPDPRTIAAAKTRGYDLTALRARRAASADFHEFDWLLAMDGDHLNWLRNKRPADSPGQMKRFLDFSPEHVGQDMPDPYYGGPDGFERVLDLAEAAGDGLLETLLR